VLVLPRFGELVANGDVGKSTMSDLVRDAKQEFWRPPLAEQTADPVMAEACRRCGTEFMVGAAFCHICGLGRHRASATPSDSWTSHLEFLRALEFTNVKNWFGLPLASLCAFLVGLGFLVVALSMGLLSVRDNTDFEAVQLWRIQWLMAACAAFLAGILLKTRKAEN
jgi:ribosomal protein L37E